MIKLFFIVALTLSTSAFGYSLTYAASVDADVIMGDHCVVNQAASGVDVPLMTFDTYKVTKNKNNVNAVCNFNIPEEGTDLKRAVTNRDLNCRITFGDGSQIMADDAHVVTTPGGKAVLTCKYRNNS